MKKLAIALCLILCLAPLSGLAAANEVNVFNWEDYIAEEALALFTAETGIKVNYMRFTTNEDMLVQVRADASNYDVIFPSDYIIERLISEDLLEELNFDNIPNYAYILDWLKAEGDAPDGQYAVPYMWGTVGILYNTDMVEEDVTSWGILFDEKYKDDVFMMDSMRDSIGVTLKMLGYSMNTRDEADLNAARDALIAQKKAGIVKAYQVDETKDKMIAGEAALALMWSGDAAYAMSFNDALAYVVPDEGTNVWVDGMCIPKGAKNKTNAEIFIDFMCRPDIALLNFEEIWYSTPNAGVLEMLDEETLSDETLFPTDETIARCEFFYDLGDAVTVYNKIWLAIKSAR